MDTKKLMILLLLYFGIPLAATGVHTAINRYLLYDPVYGISTITGILAATWLMFQFILSSRMPVIEKGIGLDRILAFHRVMGAVSILLLVPHLVLKLLIFPPSLQPLIGFAAFIGLAGAAVFSMLMFGPPQGPAAVRRASQGLKKALGFDYQKVKLLHNGTFILSLIVAVHVALSSAVLTGGFLTFYFVVVLLAGTAGYLYRKLLKPGKISTQPWRVESVVPIAEDHTEILMSSPLGVRLSHVWHERLPGQFAYFTFLGIASGKEEHPFTISTYGDPSTLRITVKSVGDFTSRLGEVKPGDPVSIEGPLGVYSYRSFPSYKEHPQVFIAGGIGITPFLAMCEDLKVSQLNERPGRVSLLWGAMREDYFVHREEFEMLQQEWEGFSFHPVTGYIDNELLDRYISEDDISHGRFFLCGPPVMMRAMTGMLRSRGVAPRRIIAERFSV